MNLTQKQATFLEAFDWLLDPESENTGRTHLLAVAYIRQMLANPGQRFEILDHKSPFTDSLNLLEKIEDLVDDAGVGELFFYRIFDYTIEADLQPSTDKSAQTKWNYRNFSLEYLERVSIDDNLVGAA